MQWTHNPLVGSSTLSGPTPQSPTVNRGLVYLLFWARSGQDQQTLDRREKIKMDTLRRRRQQDLGNTECFFYLICQNIQGDFEPLHHERLYAMNRSGMLIKLMVTVTAFVMFTLSGCDDSSTDSEDSADALVGTWNLTGMVLYYGSSIANADSTLDLFDEDGIIVLTFNTDSTGSDAFIDYDGTVDTHTWTYTATAYDLTITEPVDDWIDVMVMPYELSGNTLTLSVVYKWYPSDYYSEGLIVQTFTKQ